MVTTASQAGRTVNASGRWEVGENWKLEEQERRVRSIVDRRREEIDERVIKRR